MGAFGRLLKEYWGDNSSYGSILSGKPVMTPTIIREDQKESKYDVAQQREQNRMVIEIVKNIESSIVNVLDHLEDNREPDINWIKDRLSRGLRCENFNAYKKFRKLNKS